MRHIAIALLLISTSGAAIAHEHWINRGGYKSPIDNVPCCGPQDCFTLKPGEVKEITGGYRVRAHIALDADHQYDVDMKIPYGEALPSEDDSYHLCVKWSSGEPERRCFFVLPPGT